MTLPTTRTIPLPPGPAWLKRIYRYVDAHSNTMRYSHERDRALQRLAMPLAAVAWVLVYHWWVNKPPSTTEYVWAVAAVCYSLSSLAFRFYLKKHPEGGVHIQYGFFAFDPLMVGWALYASPRAMGWWLVLMLVMIVRVGFRYGLNAMKVELGFAGLGAMLPLGFSDYWQSEYQISGTLVVMLVCSYWLFAPLSRTLAAATLAEVDKARMQSLKESLQAKSEFLSRVSHELKSPLQSVVSSLDQIEERLKTGPVEAELLSRIRRGTNALNAQLRDLLTLARGDVGKMEMNPMAFEVNELLESVAREVRPEAERKGLALIVELPPEPTFVVADPARIDQVLTNLLTNATRHTQHGSIRLKLEPYDSEGKALRFEVSDTGPGIREDSMPTLFEPYTRFGEMNGGGEGAGLGLAIVRSVLHFLDGSVRVRSAIGEGTTFSVTIPAEPVSEAVPADTTAPREHVLVVDDRQEVLEGLVGVIRQLGFQCDTALSVGTAANLLGARSYGTVLLDLEMPIKSGRDVAIDVRRGDGPNKSSRIISISAADMPENQRGWPFDGHLTKPISMQALQRAIAPPASAASPPR